MTSFFIILFQNFNKYWYMTWTPSFLPISGTPFFKYTGSNLYDNERLLFNSLESEAWNLQGGVSVNYYITSYNLDSNKVFGESRDNTVTRSFPVRTRFVLPEQATQFASFFGLQGVDEFQIYTNITHFTSASVYDPTGTSALYPAHTPQVGDLIKSHANNLLYEISYVTTTSVQFLQKSASYTLTVRPYRSEQLNVSASILSADSDDAFDELEDLFSISADIADRFEDIKYDPPATESNSPFGNW